MIILTDVVYYKEYYYEKKYPYGHRGRVFLRLKCRFYRQIRKQLLIHLIRAGGYRINNMHELFLTFENLCMGFRHIFQRIRSDFPEGCFTHLIQVR